MEWPLELALILLLAATLFQAVRLERAIGVIKRDRAALEQLVRGFSASTQAAEQGIDRLRSTAEGSGRALARQIDAGQRLQDDLRFLIERAERMADRMDGLVRAGRAVPETSAAIAAIRPPANTDATGADEPDARSQAERDLLKALRRAR
jgi:hypothetical protein